MTLKCRPKTSSSVLGLTISYAAPRLSSTRTFWDFAKIDVTKTPLGYRCHRGWLWLQSRSICRSPTFDVVHTLVYSQLRWLRNCNAVNPCRCQWFQQLQTCTARCTVWWSTSDCMSILPVRQLFMIRSTGSVSGSVSRTKLRRWLSPVFVVHVCLTWLMYTSLNSSNKPWSHHPSSHKHQAIGVIALQLLLYDLVSPWFWCLLWFGFVRCGRT